MSDLPAELRYAKSHEWAKREGDGAIRVGISDHAQHELGDLVFVELPEIGSKVVVGKECAVVESVKAASDIFSPVTGEIIAINESVVDSPESINDDCYAQWLFMVRPDDIQELEQLFDASAYQAYIELA